MSKMPRMIRYSPGDVVLVQIIFSEGIGAKKRPALVISKDNYHAGRQDIVVAAITSNIKRVLPGDTKISHWENAGLLYPSLVTGILQTIKQNAIQKKLGSLESGDFQLVRKNLSSVLAL